jgi:hypothetical protein
VRLARALGARWPDSADGGPANGAATSTPNEAAAASRFTTAAVAGISRLRNATTSSRKLSPMMARMNHGSFAFTTVAK